jgi:hypothetical protein
VAGEDWHPELSLRIADFSAASRSYGGALSWATEKEMFMIRRRTLCIVAAAGLPLCASAMAQQASREVAIKADSGRLMGAAGGPLLGQEAVRSWSHEVTIPEASWLRVHFGPDTVLAGPDRQRGGSYLVITSARDWSKQYLDATTLPEWDRISAFLNGETVFIELYTVPGNGENRVTIEGVTAGPMVGARTRSAAPWTTGCRTTSRGLGA